MQHDHRMLLSRTHIPQILRFDGWTILQDEQGVGGQLYHLLPSSIRNCAPLRNESIAKYCEDLCPSFLHWFTGVDMFRNHPSDRGDYDFSFSYFRQNLIPGNQWIPRSKETQGTNDGSIHGWIIRWHVPQGKPKGHPLCHQLLDQYRFGCIDGRVAWVAPHCASADNEEETSIRLVVFRVWLRFFRFILVWYRV